MRGAVAKYPACQGRGCENARVSDTNSAVLPASAPRVRPAAARKYSPFTADQRMGVVEAVSLSAGPQPASGLLVHHGGVYCYYSPLSPFCQFASSSTPFTCTQWEYRSAAHTALCHAIADSPGRPDLIVIRRDHCAGTALPGRSHIQRSTRLLMPSQRCASAA